MTSPATAKLAAVSSRQSHPHLARAGAAARWTLAVLAGLACLIVAPAQLALPAVILLGCGIGALFPLSLIVSMDHVRDPAGAGALLGFVQGGGYIIASSMPFIAGLIRQHSSSLAQAWMVMAGGVVVLLLIAVRFAPGVRLAAVR